MIFARACIEADSTKRLCGHLPHCEIGDEHPPTMVIEPHGHSFEAALVRSRCRGLLMLTIVRLGKPDAFADHA